METTLLGQRPSRLDIVACVEVHGGRPAEPAFGCLRRTRIVRIVQTVGR
jgi:hypothetical protein